MDSNHSTRRIQTSETKRQAKKFAQIAADYFSQDYNCAQSVLKTMQEYYGVPKNELIPGIATAFGGGIGRRGSLCGALTGGVMAIGLKHGTNRTALKEKEKAYRIAIEFYDRFVEECGSPFCRELIGYDLTDAQDLERMRKSNSRQKKCINFVKHAIEILVGIETCRNSPRRS
jgi:C_GCAxxG_C_C family probable redox protein